MTASIKYIAKYISAGQLNTQYLHTIHVISSTVSLSLSHLDRDKLS